MTYININDHEQFEIRSVRLEPSEDIQAFKFVVRLKERGKEDMTAKKFGWLIPFDVIRNGAPAVKEK